jgi:hypothetical protein
MSKVSLLLSLGLALTATLGNPVNTLTAAPNLPDWVVNSPVELDLLSPENAMDRTDVITIDAASARRSTIPSLWWTSDRYPPKSIRNWFAYPSQKRIDLIVNQQFWWSIFSYVDRYRLVGEFGRIGREYGYNVRVFDTRGVLVGAYLCESTGNSNNTNTGNTNTGCRTWLETNSASGILRD